MDKKPTVPEVLPLVNAYYAMPGNGVGGSLHVVLEEGNVRDGDVEFCRQIAIDDDDPEGVVLAEILLRMSRTQRLKLCASHGYPVSAVPTQKEE